ncbi:MAG: hypothetical protein ACE1ZA_15575 [Pseudomonadales bacterium]
MAIGWLVDKLVDPVIFIRASGQSYFLGSVEQLDNGGGLGQAIECVADGAGTDGHGVE